MAHPPGFQSIECQDRPGGQLDPVHRPSPRTVLEDPKHVELLLQRFRIDLGPNGRRARVQRVGIVQISCVEEFRIKAVGCRVGADEKHFAVSHRAQIVEAHDLGVLSIVRKACASRQNRR